MEEYQPRLRKCLSRDEIVTCLFEGNYTPYLRVVTKAIKSEGVTTVHEVLEAGKFFKEKSGEARFEPRVTLRNVAASPETILEVERISLQKAGYDQHFTYAIGSIVTIPAEKEFPRVQENLEDEVIKSH